MRQALDVGGESGRALQLVEQPGLRITVHGIEVAGSRAQAESIRCNDGTVFHADPGPGNQYYIITMRLLFG